MEQLKITFNENENENKKITFNSVIDYLFVNQTKENKQNLLDCFNDIITINNENEAIKIFLNSNIKRKFIENISKCFDAYIVKIVKNLSNENLRTILFKTFCNDYKLIRKLKSKFENLHNFAIDEKTQTYKSVCKSFILSIFNFYKLQILQVKENDKINYVVCDFEEWQTLLKNSYNNYMQQLKTFFEDGGATNNTPKNEAIKKLN